MEGKRYLTPTPAIAQLVEHLTVDSADIRWSLVRFRVAGFIAPLLIVLTSVPLYLPHSTSHQTGWCLWTKDTSGRDSFINGSCECFDDNANHGYPTSVGAAVSQEIVFEKLIWSIIFILCNLAGSRAASRIQLLYADQLKKTLLSGMGNPSHQHEIQKQKQNHQSMFH